MTKIERRSFLKGAAAISAITILKPTTAFGSGGRNGVDDFGDTWNNYLVRIIYRE